MTFTRSLGRLAVFLAVGHFLIYYGITAAFLLVPRSHGRPDMSPFWILLRAIGVLSWPSDLLISRDLFIRWAFPPFAAIPVGVASIVWSCCGCAIWLIVRAVWRRRLPSRYLQFVRQVAFVIACVLFTSLFFGPVAGFAGDLMFGILDAARHMDGQFLYRPVWVFISVLLWAISIVAAYKFIFARRQCVSPATI